MAKLLDQLRQLRVDLVQLVDRDPDQEVTGQAIPLIDAVITEAREALPGDSSLRTQIVDIISTTTIEVGEPLRAADALIIVGQLLAVLGASSDESLLVADRRLLEEFQTLLPSAHGAAAFLREHDLGANFRWDDLTPLGQFIQQWDNAEHRFHDDEVDTERGRLLALASDFLARLSLESGPEVGGWQSVVSGQYRDDFRLGGRPDDLRRVNALNAMATEVYEQHQRFIENARRRLAV